jgi:hypothetical protein
MQVASPIMRGNVSAPPSGNIPNYNNVQLILQFETGDGGSIVDQSKNNLTPLFGGTTPVIQTAQSAIGTGSCFFTNGNISYTNAELEVSNKNYVIECYVRLQSVLSRHTILGWNEFTNSQQGSPVLMFRGDTLFYSILAAGFVDIISVPIVQSTWVNTWNFVAIVRNDTSYQMYINGSLAGSGTYAPSLTVNNTFLLGRRASANPLGGWLDAVRLTTNEIFIPTVPTLPYPTS